MKVRLFQPSFITDLKNNPVPLIREVRQRIEAKKGNERVVLFSFGSDKIKIDIKNNKLRVKVYKPKKEKVILLENELPEIFVKHVKFYLFNLGWSFEKVKLFHELKGGKFFEKSTKRWGDYIIAGWRGVFLISCPTKKEVNYLVNCFLPLSNGKICSIAGTNSLKEAELLASYLSCGACFSCRIKLGEGSFCSFHEVKKVNSWIEGAYAF